LLDHARKALCKQGFTPGAASGELVGSINGTAVRVTLQAQDFNSLPTGSVGAPHLLIGCCLADLYPPHAFASVLHRLAGPTASPLVYLPITFAGNTTLAPALPDEPQRRVPSDHYAMVRHRLHASHAQS
jgi:hypothetical protein